MIAGLPMYDWPQSHTANDRFWAAIRGKLAAEGQDAPETLTRDIGLWELWQNAALVLGQTCGLPYRSRLHGRVTLVGTPDYGLPDAPAGHYYSTILVRRDESRRFADYECRTLAFNGHDSQSGWAAAQNHAAEQGFRFRHTLHTGSHRESARAVAEGRADIAVVDAITWRLFRRFLPDEAAVLDAIGHTCPTPGLPLIAAPGRDPAPLRRAVGAAIAALCPEDRDDLGGIAGLSLLPDELYLAVPTPPPPSQDAPAA